MVTYVYLLNGLYTNHSGESFPGAPDHKWLGRLQCSNVECCSKVRSHYQGGLTQGRGCCRKQVVLQVQRCIHLNDQITTRPQAVGLGGLYSGDTLCHHPMGAGHVILLQLAGTYEVPHPGMKPPYHDMLNSAKH